MKAQVSKMRLEGGPAEPFGLMDPITSSMGYFEKLENLAGPVSARLQLAAREIGDGAADDRTELVQCVLAYLRANYAREMTRESIAEVFGYNPCYLGRVFKEKTGVGFCEYLAKYRIERSMLELAATQDNLVQIASRVGYNNRFSYIRNFKKYLSVTPSEYRIILRPA